MIYKYSMNGLLQVITCVESMCGAAMQGDHHVKYDVKYLI